MSKLLDYTGLQHYHEKVQEEISQLGLKVGDVTYQETAASPTWVDNSYVKKADGSIASSTTNKVAVISLGNAKQIRFLGLITIADSYSSGYAFYDANGNMISRSGWQFGVVSNAAHEYIIPVPEVAATFKCTSWKTRSDGLPVLTTDFYCYLISGESVMDVLNDTKGVGIDCYEGNYLYSDSKPIGSKDFSVSPFIPVAPNDVVTIHTGLTSSPASNSLYMIGYNSSKEFISGQYWNISNAAYLPERDLTPTNANLAYIRIGYYNKSEAFVRVNYVTKWISSAPVMGLDEYELRNVGGTKHLYEVGEYIDFSAAYVNYGTAVVTSSQINSLTGYIDISGYDKIRVTISTINGDSDAGLVFYNSNGAYISGVKPRNTGTKGYEERIITVPEGAKYIRTTIYNEYVSNWYLDGIKASRYVEKPNPFDNTSFDSYSVDYTLSPGYVRAAVGGNGPGSFYESDLNKCTGYVALNGATKVKFLANKPINAENVAGYAFYDEYKQCIAYFVPPYDSTQEVTGTQELIAEVPDGAEFFATEIINESASLFYLDLLYERDNVVPTLVEKDFPYTPTTKRFSKCRDFGTQPAADGTSGAFCNVTGGGYSDLLTAVYDPLVASFPTYITKYNIGKDTTGEIDMYGYVFEPKYYQQTVFLTSGVHADEVDSIASLARIMQLIANATETDEDLYFLRTNVRFIVVPVVNVWGFSQSPKSRTNSDGTAIQQWSANPLPTELQNVKTFLEGYKKNASFVMDLHTTTNSNYPDFYGVINQNAPNGRTILRTAAWLGDHYTGRTRTLTGWDGYVPIGVRAIQNTTLNQYWNNIENVTASTMELTDYIWDGSATNTHATANIITMGVTMFLNYLIQQANDFYKQETEVNEYGKTKG